MTAPGHDALLITLLAAFTACTGYAAGRLHQWYRTGLDRDEAYRDGYDTATRSVFSMAARLIGPRRAVRGTAAVTSAVITTAPVPGGPGVLAGSVSENGILLQAPTSPADPAPAPFADAAPAPFADPAPEPAPPSRARLAPGAAAEPSVAASSRGGRHLVPDELVQGPTYRLPPDRVARAKVRGAAPAGTGEEETRKLPSVPRPRSS
ncbi:hypothetical protein Asp14428_66370 [Actinoplanes sp. NBRC 14428]|uniref:Uncharacterized protein n=1 Tax=Pseudosporangium ferrugineum TaxID=439699 RepID=A0A2T0RNV8_9ACTN|nr:hypothetical protein [Pseudosporangium ferrugineum]PRY22831.1 hypothetical protein CLV70_11691 [Pseudosporangium ferrugineum]BCJ55162.1 hypothetical protein Asp14428_66370 [Actinoplanes sp. NBRC 14428]